MCMPPTPPSRSHFAYLIGVPWVSGGRDFAVGLDCWGLVMVAGKHFGHLVPDVAALAHSALQAAKERKRVLPAYFAPAAGPAPGVYVELATHPMHPNLVDHFGILVDARTLLHCARGMGVTADSLDMMGNAAGIRGLYNFVGPTC